MAAQDQAGGVPPRAALYVDFDNVFMALLRWDERAAYALGERPDAWLAWLEREPEGGALRRRTLVRRCYLNPGRWIDFPSSGPVARYRAQRDMRNRVFFGEFRGAFVRAGFDVVDCPPVASLKNAADMKMALDIREALDHPTRFEEFVLLSGDSDFLPALTRLRAHDRRITILAQDTAKEAYLAAADQALGLVEFANQGMGSLPITGFELAAPVRDRAAALPRPPEPPRRLAEPPRSPAPTAAEPARRAAPPPSRPAEHDPAALRAAALRWLRDLLAASEAGALRMTQVGSAIAKAMPELRESRYAGAGTLGKLIEEAGDPHLALAGPPDRRWLYDPDRGQPPADPAPDAAPPPPNGAAPAEEAAGTAEPEDEQEPEDRPEDSAEDEPEDEAPPGPEDSYAALAAASPPPDWTGEPEPAGDAAPEPPPAPDPAEREAAMAEAAAKVRDLLWGKRDLKGFPLDLPAFASAEIGFVLSGIAAASPFGPSQLPGVAAGIAADGAPHGIHVSPREVTAVIRWLLRGNARFRDRLGPDGAFRLAATLYDQLGRAVERAAAQRTTAPRPEERLAEEEWAALEAWMTAGLSGD
ncbi:NYN domain-containing protein [Falsiroseomonas sp. CW058]|uniref:NYN domain-containing protein n=1 Tax=Falsiroseomonas sp. CW058 TaxID=3388664 RepID=UPI003D316B8B